MKYYLDESGNSGDLIKSKIDMSFDNQPFFVLACLKENDQWDISGFIKSIREKYSLRSQELDLASLYKNKPYALKVIIEEISKKTEILAEVVDKRYFICTAITNTQLWPPYYNDNSDVRKTRFMVPIISDFIYSFFSKEDYHLFYKASLTANTTDIENSIRKFQSIGQRFLLDKGHCRDFYELSNLLIYASKETLDDFEKSIKINADRSSLFIPLPDIDHKKKKIILLPHVSSFANIYATVNKQHKNKISECLFIHDEQKHFDKIIKDTKKTTEESKTHQNPTHHVDFNFLAAGKLEFGASKDSNWLQLTDLVAGFLSRYARDRFTNAIKLDIIYHEIWDIIVSSKPGINLVAALSTRHGLTEPI